MNPASAPDSASRSVLHRIALRAHTPIPIDSVALFRVAFGAIMFWEVVRYFQRGWIQSIYVDPPFHFSYLGFSWVQPLPGWGMYAFFIGLGLVSAAVCVGFSYRLASVLLFLGVTYLFLLEKAAYLNHAYLICLVSFLMMFIPANGAYSFDARRHRELRSSTLPAGWLWLLRFQIAVPYVYGGIAKLTPDWLSGQPMQIWLMRDTKLVQTLPALGEPWMALVFSYGGLMLDLLVVPALLWKPTRAWAFGFAVLFHLLNAMIFSIGIFPWLMICATTLFFEPDWSRRFFRQNVSNDSPPQAAPSVSRRHKWLVALMGLWCVVQLLVPFRHWLYPNNVNWSAQGYPFSWRMMLNDKAAVLQLVYRHPPTGRAGPIDPRGLLTSQQIDRMSQMPELLHEFAVLLSREMQQGGLEGVEIRALVYCSLNGRRPQLLVDPQTNLAAEPRSLKPLPWILPLKEPLPDEPWLIPPSHWHRHIDFAEDSRRLAGPRPSLP